MPTETPRQQVQRRPLSSTPADSRSYNLINISPLKPGVRTSTYEHPKSYMEGVVLATLPIETAEMIVASPTRRVHCTGSPPPPEIRDPCKWYMYDNRELWSVADKRRVRWPWTNFDERRRMIWRPGSRRNGSHGRRIDRYIDARTCPIGPYQYCWHTLIRCDRLLAGPVRRISGAGNMEGPPRRSSVSHLGSGVQNIAANSPNPAARRAEKHFLQSHKRPCGISGYFLHVAEGKSSVAEVASEWRCSGLEKVRTSV